MMAIIGINELVSSQGAIGCQLFCDQQSCHRAGASTYYPAVLQPFLNLLIPAVSAHPDVDLWKNNSLTPE